MSKNNCPKCGTFLHPAALHLCKTKKKRKSPTKSSVFESQRILMIEKSAYDALQAKLDETQAELELIASGQKLGRALIQIDLLNLENEDLAKRLQNVENLLKDLNKEGLFEAQTQDKINKYLNEIKK